MFDSRKFQIPKEWIFTTPVKAVLTNPEGWPEGTEEIISAVHVPPQLNRRNREEKVEMVKQHFITTHFHENEDVRETLRLHRKRLFELELRDYLFVSMAHGRPIRYCKGQLSYISRITDYSAFDPASPTQNMVDAIRRLKIGPAYLLILDPIYGVQIIDPLREGISPPELLEDTVKPHTADVWNIKTLLRRQDRKIRHAEAYGEELPTNLYTEDELKMFIGIDCAQMSKTLFAVLSNQLTKNPRQGHVYFFVRDLLRSIRTEKGKRKNRLMTRWVHGRLSDEGLIDADYNEVDLFWRLMENRERWEEYRREGLMAPALCNYFVNVVAGLEDLEKIKNTQQTTLFGPRSFDRIELLSTNPVLSRFRPTEETTNDGIVRRNFVFTREDRSKEYFDQLAREVAGDMGIPLEWLRERVAHREVTIEPPQPMLAYLINRVSGDIQPLDLASVRSSYTKSEIDFSASWHNSTPVQSWLLEKGYLTMPQEFYDAAKLGDYLHKLSRRSIPEFACGSEQSVIAEINLREAIEKQLAITRSETQQKETFLVRKYLDEIGDEVIIKVTPDLAIEVVPPKKTLPTIFPLHLYKPFDYKTTMAPSRYVISNHARQLATEVLVLDKVLSRKSGEDYYGDEGVVKYHRCKDFPTRSEIVPLEWGAKPRFDAIKHMAFDIYWRREINYHSSRIRHAYEFYRSIGKISDLDAPLIEKALRKADSA